MGRAAVEPSGIVRRVASIALATTGLRILPPAALPACRRGPRRRRPPIRSAQVGDVRRSVRSPGSRIVAAGRLPGLTPSGIWPAAPRSQLRDSAGFSPASLIRAALFVMACGGYSAGALSVSCDCGSVRHQRWEDEMRSAASRDAAGLWRAVHAETEIVDSAARRHRPAVTLFAVLALGLPPAPQRGRSESIHWQRRSRHGHYACIQV